MSSSWQLLPSHLCLSLLADSILGWRCGYSFEWHIPETATRKLAKARGQQTGPTSPAFPLITLLGHQRVCFPNALTRQWAKPHVEPLVDQTSLKTRLWDLLKILAVHCTAGGRAFYKILNTIAISSVWQPHAFPASFSIWPCLTDSLLLVPVQESISAS